MRGIVYNTSLLVLKTDPHTTAIKVNTNRIAAKSKSIFFNSTHIFFDTFC
jgi:hypothetical protein